MKNFVKYILSLREVHSTTWQSMGGQGFMDRRAPLAMTWLSFFIIVFGFSGSLNALTSEQRFAEVQKKYPNAEKFTPNAKSAFVYVEGAQLTAQKPALKIFFKDNPDATLMIDFARGDGFVDETGKITLQEEPIPSSLEKIVISNAQGDITSIGKGFLCGCRGLQTIDLSPLSAVTSIEDYFLWRCNGLQTIDLSGLSNVTRIGNYFLFRCEKLQTIDLSPLSAVTSIGNDFLSGCVKLQTIDLSPLSAVTSIGGLFLSGCVKLQTIDLSPLSAVTSIGDLFLSGCEKLQTIDLSGLSNVTRIGNYFLFRCEKLQTIDLSPLSAVTSIVNDFLSGCRILTSIIGLDEAFMDRLDDASRINVVKALRESNAPALQALGQTFYIKYIYKPDLRIEAVQKIWSFEMLKGITPKPLDDIPTMTKDHVLAAFDAAFAKSSDLPEATRLYYNSHLKPILRFIFGEEDAWKGWKMYKEQLAEMQIVLKHMAKMLNDRIAKSEAVDGYMAMMLDGFVHCQSRQAAELNRVAMMMGLMPMSTDKGNLKDIYAMVNAFKYDKFEAMIGLKSGAHEYMRAFTAINGTIGLPVAMQSFHERMNPASDEEINNTLATYFSAFFTPDLLADYLLQEIKKVDAGKDLKADKTALSRVLHGEMYKLGDEAFKEIYEEFYGDELLEKIKNPITPDEIMHLLKLMGILRTEEKVMEG